MAEVKCPKCGKQTHLKRIARPVGTVTGMVAGGGLGVIGAKAGSKVGKFIACYLFGDGGEIFGEILGGIVGFISGAATASYAGHKLGALLDEDVFAQYKCNCCGHEFKQ